MLIYDLNRTEEAEGLGHWLWKSLEQKSTEFIYYGVSLVISSLNLQKNVHFGERFFVVDRQMVL